MTRISNIRAVSALEEVVASTLNHKWNNFKQQPQDSSNEMDLRTEPVLHSQDITDNQDVSDKSHAKTKLLESSHNLVDTLECTGQPRSIQV